ncbi:hypothetical protein SAMN05192539_102393 [Paraburkholderia diazotrophica]|uniref:Uncharacterized protein n=1 Tax=Paraburkholderia diazotrophica TaxID=667676 RepID=A0A1H7CYK5_9BURK|nr:hypothetical protein SAMN05192539_102393 [Paraburkholderia diazotrophica]
MIRKASTIFKRIAAGSYVGSGILKMPATRWQKCSPRLLDINVISWSTDALANATGMLSPYCRLAITSAASSGVINYCSHY